MLAAEARYSFFIRATRATIAVALALQGSGALSQENCSFGNRRQSYATAYFFDPTAQNGRRVVGNAFAIHAQFLGRCDFEGECSDAEEARGMARWQLYFATAAHVVVDLCEDRDLTKSKVEFVILKSSSGPAGELRLPVPKNWCNDHIREARSKYNVGQLINDVRAQVLGAETGNATATSDQYYFPWTIQVSDRDLVTPYVASPLPAGNTITPLRFRAVGVHNAQLVEGGSSKSISANNDAYFVTTNAADFQTEIVGSSYDLGVKVPPGASGSPVVLLDEGRLRVVGIITNYVQKSCAEAADFAKTGGEVSEPQKADQDPTTPQATDRADEVPATELVESEAQREFREQSELSAFCRDDTVAAYMIGQKHATFVPVLRDLELILKEVKRDSWTLPRSTRRNIKALVNAARAAADDPPAQAALKAELKELLASTSPFEWTLMMSRLKTLQKLRQNELFTYACASIEPRF